MKLLFALLLSALLLPSFGFAQQYTYDTVASDPLKTRIYTLKNGLKVFLTVYKDEPRIHTIIAVRAGSKNDPRETTGLAHYFEHLMFKGTSKFGTANWEKEKPYIVKIDSLFEIYRFIKDTAKRRNLYHIIDSISYIASKYAIPNEYFRLTSLIGGKGTNASTSYDQTVYINNIPSNQIENWLSIESNRFSDPVLRLFHTELETIYEEKNMGMTNDSRKATNALSAELYKNHPYGTSIIGESDHIKNPSLKNITQFYHDYYIPNNMAICLSGDLDPDKTIALIDKTFGNLKPSKIPDFTYTPEMPITAPITKEVFGPDAEKVLLAFRFNGYNSKDADMITMMDMLLNNSSAGLIDLNLNNKQKVLQASSFPMKMKDYSFLMLSGSPKQGQSLDEVKTLLLAQLDSIKKGAFPNWLPKAIINNMKLEEIKSYEINEHRVQTLVNAFIYDTPLKDIVGKYARFEKITKQELMDFAKNSFKDNYVCIYKRTGEDKTLDKIAKPPITPIIINRDSRSVFLDTLEKRKSIPIQPSFIDYKKDIITTSLKNKTPVYYTKNTENNTFELYLVYDMGTNNNKEINIALEYLNYLGIAGLNNEKLSQEFYKLACSFTTSCNTDQLNISLTGLNDNFEPALKLLLDLLSKPEIDTNALSNLKSDILKRRTDAKKNPKAIYQAMVSYGVYGAISPFTNQLSNEQIKALSAEQLINELKILRETNHHVLYYGPKTSVQLTNILNKYDNFTSPKDVTPAIQFKEQSITSNIIYIINFDVKQANLVLLSNGINQYNPSIIPTSGLFNKYFGAGPGSVVFQEIREARSMAYTATSNYQAPRKKDQSFFDISFIGTQHDKLCNAFNAMTTLLDSLPLSEKSFNNAKEAILQSMPSERINKSDVLFSYENAKKLGLDYDIRKDIYEKTKTLTLTDINTFHQTYIKGKPRYCLILGNAKLIDTNCYKNFGEIKTLTLTELFGY